MRYTKVWTFGVILVGVLMIGLGSVARAERFATTISRDETVDGSLYSAGKVVDIDGVVNGDIFCAGQTVTIEATVHGDVLCAGSDVTIGGTVDGDVRVAGQNVSMDAQTKGSVSVAAITFSLDANARVGHDLTAIGDDMNIKGNVARDVVISGSTAALNGQVGRNVRYNGQALRLRSNAIVNGDLRYTSTESADIAQGSTVRGRTLQTRPERRRAEDNALFAGLNMFFYLFCLAGIVGVGLVLAYFFPKLMENAGAIMHKSFSGTAIVGLVASLLLPFIILGLSVTLVGLPVALFVGLAWLSASVLSMPLAAYYAGRMILRHSSQSPLLTALVGGAVVATLEFVPVLGVIAGLLAYWVGFGAILLLIRPFILKSAAPPKHVD